MSTKKCHSMEFGSTLQRCFIKLLFLRLWCGIKEQPQLSYKTTEIFLPFPITYLHDTPFLHKLQPKEHYNRINSKANITLQLSSMKFLLKKFVKM